MTHLQARLLCILRGDEGFGPEPLSGRQEGHHHHLAGHNGRVEGVGLKQIFLHVEHVV